MADSNFVSSGYYLVKGEAKRLHDGRVYVVTDNGYAEDMREVVRCEDCKWFFMLFDDEQNTEYPFCSVWGEETHPHCFCAWCKPKEGE